MSLRRRMLVARAAFLLLAAGATVGAVHVRGESEQGDEESRGLTGVNGQRQALELGVDAGGKPVWLDTTLYSHCSYGAEYPSHWAPVAGPAEFVSDGDEVRVREERRRRLRDGYRAHATFTMHATRLPDGRGFAGAMRARWRFTDHGRLYAACDSGQVPFATGPGASRALGRVDVTEGSRSLYPVAPAAAARAADALVARAERTCAATDGQMLAAHRRAARGLRWWPAGERALYVRWHGAELAALRRLAPPGRERTAYEAWLAAYGRQVALERRQVALLFRGRLVPAAALQARIATWNARANAAGGRLGLRTCVDTGPTGAPRPE